MDGTTWDMVVAEAPKWTDPDSYSKTPWVDFFDTENLAPSSAALGNPLQLRLNRDLYLVICATSTADGSTSGPSYPAILLQVLDR